MITSCLFVQIAGLESGTREATAFVDVALKHPTVFEHDVLSRVVERREPDDEAGEAVTTTSYDIEELDGVGRFVATEVDPNGSWTTTRLGTS